MTNKSTKRALFSSIIALMLCFTMLIGTTFAWFTDSVTSAGNMITAGNLKVDLELLDKETNTWASVKDSNDPIFTAQNWEPGFVDAKILKVENFGSLALKWKATFTSEKALSELADVIDVYVCSYGVLADATSIAYPADRNLENYGYASAGTLATFLNSISDNINGELPAGQSAYIGIALKMREGAGNEYQNLDLAGAFDLTFVATQLNSEEDSFGKDYDANASYVTPVATLSAFFDAVDNGDDILLTDQISVNKEFIDYMNERYPATTFALGNETENISTNAIVDGNGITVYRTANLANKPIFAVASGYTLTLSDITLDGGAVWEGEIDETLGRPITNAGMTTTANIIILEDNANIVLNEGAVLQNNDGASALYPSFKSNATVTMNGGWIINNNTPSGGAVWGGAHITMNEGSKINGNYSASSAGAIRMVSGRNLVINGGEISNNKALGDGGAIWGYGASNYTFSSGEMSGNVSEGTGGAIYTGTYSVITISGDFEMLNNKAANSGAIRLTDHTSLTMTGGKISGNTQNGESNAFNTWNNTIKITGGILTDNISYVGGLGLTIGLADIDGVIAYNLSTNHNTAYLAEEFNGFSFTVNEADANFSAFNFKPAAGYTYTEGDEDKLVCLNDGYETYWDAEKSVFRLAATN